MTKAHKKSGLDSIIDEEIKEVKREWKHFKKFKDENYLLFTAFVILVSAIVIVNTVYILDHNSNNTPRYLSGGVSDIGKVLTSQQAGQNSAVKVSVSSVTEDDKTDYAFSAEPGTTMLIMSVTITNLTNATQHLIPVSQFFVHSDEGDYAPLHASMYVTKPLEANDLAPGKSATGQISFSVPKRVARPLLFIDTGWDKNVPIVFDVLH